MDKQLIWSLGIVLRGLLSICAHLFSVGNSGDAAPKMLIKEMLIAWGVQRGNYVVRSGSRGPLDMAHLGRLWDAGAASLAPMRKIRSRPPWL